MVERVKVSRLCISRPGGLGIGSYLVIYVDWSNFAQKELGFSFKMKIKIKKKCAQKTNKKK